MMESIRACQAHALASETQAPSRILRRPLVEQRTGLSRSAIYAMMAKGQFPAPVHLTVKAVGWLEADISDWILRRARDDR